MINFLTVQILKSNFFKLGISTKIAKSTSQLKKEVSSFFTPCLFVGLILEIACE